MSQVPQGTGSGFIFDKEGTHFGSTSNFGTDSVGFLPFSWGYFSWWCWGSLPCTMNYFIVPLDCTQMDVLDWGRHWHCRTHSDQFPCHQRSIQHKSRPHRSICLSCHGSFTCFAFSWETSLLSLYACFKEAYIFPSTRAQLCLIKFDLSIILSYI